MAEGPAGLDGGMPKTSGRAGSVDSHQVRRPLAMINGIRPHST